MEPTNTWAVMSRHYIAHVCRPRGPSRSILDRHASATPANDRAAFLVKHINSQPAPYVDRLPEPTDVTANMLRQFIERRTTFEDGDTLNLKVNLVEAPSTRLALGLFFEGLGKKVTVNYTVKGVQSPDPRRPVDGCTDPLWLYPTALFSIAKEAVVAVPPPGPLVADSVAGLAARPFQIREWATRSQQLAQELGVPALPALRAVMVHPPSPPQGTRAWAWVPLLQTAAALVIAHLDGEWKDSVRRSALLSLARGPLDWITEAVIIALTEVALAEPTAYTEVQDLFSELEERIPSDGHCCYEYGLVCCWQQLANPDAVNARLLEWRSRLECENNRK
jgi:hypothetical protein